MPQFLSAVLPYVNQASVGSALHAVLKSLANAFGNDAEKRLVNDDALWQELVNAAATVTPEVIAAYKQFSDVLAKVQADLV